MRFENWIYTRGIYIIKKGFQEMLNLYFIPLIFLISINPVFSQTEMSQLNSDFLSKEQLEKFFIQYHRARKDSTSGNQLNWKKISITLQDTSISYKKSFEQDLPSNCLDLSKQSVSDFPPCSLSTFACYTSNGNTFSFTVGRAPEECNEVPRMLWQDSSKIFKESLTEFYDYDIAGMWYVQNLIIFYLIATYEYGDVSCGIGIWNVNEGTMTKITRLTETSSKSEITIISDELTNSFRHLGDALIGVLDDVVYLKTQVNTIAIFPKSNEWCVISK